MKHNSIFWAFVLIIGGALLLLNNLNIIQVGWNVIWPLFLVALGLWFLWGAFAAPRRTAEPETVSIPLHGARQAEVKIEHGAGTLNLTGGAPAGSLVLGQFGGGLDYRTGQEGDAQTVKLRPATSAWFLGPWHWGAALDWDMQLNSTIPMRLQVEAGASRTNLDLADLQITELKLSTGASATQVVLPAHAGLTKAKIEAGAAAVAIAIPGGVAARIRAKGGLAAIQVDETRFPRVGDEYRSPDYDSATNKIEMRVETGIGSVKIR